MMSFYPPMPYSGNKSVGFVRHENAFLMRPQNAGLPFLAVKYLKKYQKQ
jgi:hypothetical protein